MSDHRSTQHAACPLIDRRSGENRRSLGWRNLRWLLKNGARRRLRRRADSRSLQILDYYSPKLFYAIVLVLMLSVADALLTLWLIDRGAEEINPVMAYFLSFGPAIFMAVKYLLTSVSVIIVVVLHYVFIRYLGMHYRMLMQIFAGCFGLVVAWELYLIARLML